MNKLVNKEYSDVLEDARIEMINLKREISVEVGIEANGTSSFAGILVDSVSYKDVRGNVASIDIPHREIKEYSNDWNERLNSMEVRPAKETGILLFKEAPLTMCDLSITVGEYTRTIKATEIHTLEVKNVKFNFYRMAALIKDESGFKSIAIINFCVEAILRDGVILYEVTQAEIAYEINLDISKYFVKSTDDKVSLSNAVGLSVINDDFLASDLMKYASILPKATETSIGIFEDVVIERTIAEAYHNEKYMVSTDLDLLNYAKAKINPEVDGGAFGILQNNTIMIQGDVITKSGIFGGIKRLTTFIKFNKRSRTLIAEVDRFIRKIREFKNLDDRISKATTSHNPLVLDFKDKEELREVNQMFYKFTEVNLFDAIDNDALGCRIGVGNFIAENTAVPSDRQINGTPSGDDGDIICKNI